MKKHKFVILLEESTGEGEDLLFIAETTKTLKEVKKLYDRARNNWYKEDYPECEIEYIENYLSKHGVDFYLADLPEPDTTWDY